MIAFLAFAFPLALYLSFPSSLWNFDGVACAAALELGQPTYFFHSNHLLYGFLGVLFWKWIGMPLGLSRALPALQLFTSLLASFGLVGLYRLLQPLLENRWHAFLLASALAGTAAFWVWSVEAQVYALGFAALAWATFVLIHYEHHHKYIFVGILHGAAVLGHVMHILWTIPALYWIGRNLKAVRQYFAFLLLMTFIPYLLVVGLVVMPGRDSRRVLIWLKGSVGLTPDRSWAWHWPGWNGPWVWLRSTVPTFWGSFWPYGKTSTAPWLWFLTIVSVACFLCLLIGGSQRKSERLTSFSWIWLAVYGLFLSTWEPATLCYRMTDVLPVGILLALGLRRWRPVFQVVLALLFLGSTLTVNFVSRILPMHQPDQNAVYQETIMLSKMTPPNSVYVTNGGLLWIYLLYFTGRTAWNADAFEPRRLEEEIARQKQSRPVYVRQGSSWQKIP